MGLRSWLSPIATKQQWLTASESIEKGTHSNGIHYVIRLEKDIPHFRAGELVVAWSGDGSSSVECLKPKAVRDRTWLLDNYLEEFPDWHSEPGGPNKFGKAMKSEQEASGSLR